jgi:hypothetical protein
VEASEGELSSALACFELNVSVPGPSLRLRSGMAPSPSIEPKLRAATPGRLAADMGQGEQRRSAGHALAGWSKRAAAAGWEPYGDANS